MPRLLTFGCSYTFGHGLPDVHQNENNSKPSIHAWPNLLANKLNYECYNYGKIGAGNYEILLSLLKTDFLPDDLVIVAFSYFMRYDYFDIIDKQGNGLQLKYNTLEFKQLLLDRYTKNYPIKNYFDNWLAIQNCSLFLEAKKIKNLCFLIFPKGAIEPRPNFLHIPSLVDDCSFKEVDSAMDKIHPGMESHKLQAELIYNKIVKHELR